MAHTNDADDTETDNTLGMAAAAIAEQYDPTDAGYGVRNDTLLDYAMAADGYATRWSQVYHHMDAMVDDPEVVPETMMPAIAQMHQQAQAYHRFFDRLANEFVQRRAALTRPGDDEADA